MNESILKNNERSEKETLFAKLFDTVVARREETGVPTIEYNLPYPKEEFLSFLTASRSVVLHGSNTSDITELSPIQANDRAKKSGNLKAVYGVMDPVLPIFFAILDRKKVHGGVKSGLGHDQETDAREYQFILPPGSLETEPWKQGMIYILDKENFVKQYNNDGTLSGEWTCEVPVRPLAKLAVGPGDFRFLGDVGEDQDLSHTLAQES
jgi:hypothetical protein